MGIDLVVCPMLEFPPNHSSNEWLAHSRLCLHRHSELWEAIIKIPSRDIPGVINGYFGDHYVTTDRDAYGDHLRFTRAEDWIGVGKDVVGMSEWNKKIIEFLAGLPPDTQIVLYWH